MESLSTLPVDWIRNTLLLLLVLGLAAFFWRRTGTTQSILEFFWRIVCGNSPIKDPRLAAFVDEARELERFRFIFGIKLESITELHRFLDWREAHRVPIGHVQRIRKLFDASLPHFIVEPQPTSILRLFTYMLFCLASIVAIQILVAGDLAYLKTQKSQIWFTSDGTTIEQPFWKADAESSACNETQAVPAGFTAAEREILCNALQDGSLKELVDTTIRKQRRLSQWAIGFIFLAFLYLARRTDAAISARLLLARIRKSAFDNGSDAVIQKPTSPTNTTTAT